MIPRISFIPYGCLIQFDSTKVAICNQHMTSSNENIFRVTLCAGNSLATGEFSSQRPVTRSFDVFFDRRLNKRLSKQSKRRWFETPSGSLWGHCNEMQFETET